MKKILTGMILGCALTFSALWMLGNRPSHNKSASSESLDTLIHSFPNQKIEYWTDDGAYELHLYGQMAFIQRMKRDSPRKDIELKEFQAIWDQFEMLPGLQDYKNPDTNITLSRSTHHVVYVNEAAGLYLSPRSSYSIPKDETRNEYRGWSDLVESTIRKYTSRPDASSNGG